MSARQPELSIVIPVYDNWWLTARCLRELGRLRSQSPVTFEVIVVDNASTDETPEAIAGFPWVRYQRFEANRNFAGGCNAGVRLAEAPLTLLLNNDAYPVGDALTPLIRAFDRPEVTLAGGALFFEDGVTQAAGLVLLPNAHWHYFYRNLTPTLDAVNRSRDALAISGAAMALRTQWFLENGGFDESFVNGFEDVDLCLRAREQGRAIVYVAEARFIHYEAASAGRFIPTPRSLDTRRCQAEALVSIRDERQPHREASSVRIPRYPPRLIFTIESTQPIRSPPQPARRTTQDESDSAMVTHMKWTRWVAYPTVLAETIVILLCKTPAPRRITVAQS